MAVLEGHTNPVNCVRWNQIGTLFASAADDTFIIIWEYRGEVPPNSLQYTALMNANKTDHPLFGKKPQDKDQ